MTKTNFVLDTSALIAYLANEKGAGKIFRLLNEAECSIPFISLSELYYIVWNKKGKAEADKIYGIVKSWKVPVLYPDEEVILNAGRLKAMYRLGISDSYIAAFALGENSKLVTKDNDYRALTGEMNVLFIK